MWKLMRWGASLADLDVWLGYAGDLHGLKKAMSRVTFLGLKFYRPDNRQI